VDKPGFAHLIDKEDPAMIAKRRRLGKALALFLALSTFQLYVQVSAVAAPQVAGKLSTTNNRSILVDKNEAKTGATILDGMTLETSDCVGATVRFGALDEIDLGINTVAIINYSAGHVKVTLRQGCAIVRVGPDMEATIETPDGKSTPATQPDSLNRHDADVCYPSGAVRDFNPSCAGAAAATGASTSRFILIGAAAAIVGLVAVAANSGGGGTNPSDSSPT
jgi:hypothetical protein